MATVTDNELKELKDLMLELKIGQERLSGQIMALEEKLTGKITTLEEKLTGKISVLDEKVTGFGKRLENQEFTNRGILIALVVALIAGAAKLFGWLPNP